MLFYTKRKKLIQMYYRFIEEQAEQLQVRPQDSHETMIAFLTLRHYLNESAILEDIESYERENTLLHRECEGLQND